MKISLLAAVLIATLLLPACETAAKDGFEYVGKWSNVMVSRSEDPHASGYSLELWKHNGKPVGFLSEYVGPPFDPPFGPLQDLALDSNSGKLSFLVKLTAGIRYSRGHPDGAPDRTLYLFNGVLRDTDVTGTLEKQDGLDNTAPIRLEVALKRERDPNAESYWSSKTFAEWEEFYAPVLRARGPKW